MNDDMTPSEEEIDHGAIQEDRQQYMDLLNSEEQKTLGPAMAQVVGIMDGKPLPKDPGYTDDELIPLEPSDVIFEKMVFDAEQSLRNAANQKWLLDGIIPADGFGILYGPSGSYKSFLALDMAAAISTGQSWHGVDVDGCGPVLYVAAEGSMGLQERAVAWSRHYKRDYGRLAILPVAIMLDDPIMTQIFVEAAMKAQEKLGAPFKLVIIDTLARSFNGDENSSQDAGAFINSCYAWRAKLDDCSVMVITHAGKQIERGIRGSSAFKAASDFVFIVTRPNHLQALLRNEKQKDVDEAEDMRFALQSVHIGIQDHKGRERKSLVPILESKGNMADPDKEEEVESVFEVSNLMDMIRIVKANTAAGQQMTEDELRIEFSQKRTSEGAKPEAIRKSFDRNLLKAKQKGYLMKHGKQISVGEVKI